MRRRPSRRNSPRRRKCWRTCPRRSPTRANPSAGVGPLVLAAVGVVVLAGGAVAFSIIRRSTQPEPSPLPPSVDVAPKP